MSSDLFIQAHEECIAEYLDAHPEASESEAYDRTADAASYRMQAMLEDYADYWNEIRKEESRNG